jgi:hypothetical protein
LELFEQTPVDVDLFVSIMLTYCYHSLSSLTLILAALVLHSNKMIVCIHACSTAQASAEELMNAFLCDLPYTCPTCDTNFDGLGTERAGCESTEEYCTSDGTCASTATWASWNAPFGDRVKAFGYFFTQGVTGSIMSLVTESPLMGTSCNLLLNEVSCSSCTMVKCTAGAAQLKMQADCNNHGQGYLDMCQEDGGGGMGDFLQYVFLENMATCNGQGPATPEKKPSSDVGVVTTGTGLFLSFLSLLMTLSFTFSLM